MTEALKGIDLKAEVSPEYYERMDKLIKRPPLLSLHLNLTAKVFAIIMALLFVLGMAVGGSGDVLAGIIVSLLGQGIATLEAAACAAWLHGAAGDRCAKEIGQYGMLPTDMLECLPRLMK